jgi:hypothetical protein
VLVGSDVPPSFAAQALKVSDDTAMIAAKPAMRLVRVMFTEGPFGSLLCLGVI